MRIQSLRNLAAKVPTVTPVRGAKIKGPVLDLPSYEYKGKVYRKLATPLGPVSHLFNYNYRAAFRKDIIFRYMVYVSVPTYLIVSYIHNLVNSPANVAYWKVKEKKDMDDMHKEEWDL